jgi:hypothetical protein
MNPSIHLKTATLFLAIVACFALSPTAQAVSPPPDGGYPGQNTAEGDNALFSLTFGNNNTALGFEALFSNTTGGFNAATGYQALHSNTSGSDNTATGIEALFSNTTGISNTATGAGALLSNTVGTFNTATGDTALLSNTTGNNNTATGVQALHNNGTGDNNTAAGVSALYNNRSGAANTATGFQALFINTGSNNTANGYRALENNTSAVGNTANGFQALFSNRTGFNNTANGRQALQNNTNGSFNIGLGNLAGRNLTTGSNNIDIGNQGVAAEAQTIRLGEQGNQNRTFIAGISGSPIAGTSVVVNNSGRLGTVASSQRFKADIQPMNNVSEAVLALKPVTFRYKRKIDPEGISQFGLVAEDVEKVNPHLVVRDKEGKPYSVRYEAVNAMLLNEFLKEHRKVEKLEATVAQQHKDFDAAVAELKEQIQKVGAQVEVSKPAPQTVLNNH